MAPGKSSKNPAPFDCPNCGAEVPGGALACPECGSDEDTGWSEDTIYDGLDLPAFDDEDDDYGQNTTTHPSWKRGVFTLTAILLLIAFFAAYALG